MHQVYYTLIFMDIILTCVCIKGNIYIADWGNNRIRKVTVSTGIITTYAGTGSGTYSGDNGQATSAALCAPQGVALDSSGKCFS
jgi:hypothetical protein